MGSCSLTGQSSPFSRSPGYMGRRGSTRTRTILSTVRYVSDPLSHHRCVVTDFALQIISLPQSLLIVDYSLGHTGSVHDAWAFRSTRTFKDHDKIFGPGEWMWADSAYTPETWSVAPFKKPVNGQLMADQKTYNYWVSKVSYMPHSKLNISNYL